MVNAPQNAPDDRYPPQAPPPPPQLRIWGEREGGGGTKPARAFQTGTITLLPDHKWPSYTVHMPYAILNTG
jgi:hypothetical protein